MPCHFGANWYVGLFGRVSVPDQRGTQGGQGGCCCLAQCPNYKTLKVKTKGQTEDTPYLRRIDFGLRAVWLWWWYYTHKIHFTAFFPVPFTVLSWFSLNGDFAQFRLNLLSASLSCYDCMAVGTAYLAFAYFSFDYCDCVTTEYHV